MDHDDSSSSTQDLRYSSENLLTSSSGGTAATLGYDPALRLSQTVGAATTKFLYDGADAIAEYDGSNALQRRFIFDPTTGQPVLWYEGTGTAATNRRYLSQDERGSVISVSDSTSASLGLNTYDEYGKPGSANLGRYQYTGQKWIGEAGLYDYKARDYVPQLGIFAQTDPAGYGDSPNLYAYVLDDPVNLVDPSGMTWVMSCIRDFDGAQICWTWWENDIFVTARCDAYGGCERVGGPGPSTTRPDPTDPLGPRGPGGRGSPENSTVVATAKQPNADNVCRGVVAGAAALIIGGGSAYDVYHSTKAGGEAQRSLQKLGYLKAGLRGAGFGGEFGPVGAGIGAGTLMGGLYLWNRFHEQIMSSICGPKK